MRVAYVVEGQRSLDRAEGEVRRCGKGHVDEVVRFDNPALEDDGHDTGAGRSGTWVEGGLHKPWPELVH